MQSYEMVAIKKRGSEKKTLITKEKKCYVAWYVWKLFIEIPAIANTTEDKLWQILYKENLRVSAVML